MVGLKFFFSEDKEVHWIGVVEEKLARFGALPAIEIALLLLVLWGLSNLLDDAHAMTFLRSGMLGIAAFVAVDGLGHVLSQRDEKLRAAGSAVQRGLGGFIYLNVLDASFSFDAVIGAFALSNNMVAVSYTHLTLPTSDLV